MNTVIVAGGLGMPLSEETAIEPKPMAVIGGRPILWHVMSICSAHGFREFVVACGCKGETVKESFSDFVFQYSDFTVDLHSGDRTVVHRAVAQVSRTTESVQNEANP